MGGAVKKENDIQKVSKTSLTYASLFLYILVVGFPIFLLLPADPASGHTASLRLLSPPKMHHPNYLFLLLPLFSVTLAQAQANGGDIEPTPAPEQAGSPAEPTPTLPGDDIAAPENGAIVPTASGQIGINPVDLPPASYVSHPFNGHGWTWRLI